MNLESTVLDMNLVYESSRSHPRHPQSYFQALPEMRAQAEPIFGKYADAFLSKLAFKVPEDFQKYLPDSLEQAKLMMARGYTPMAVSYLSVTISSQELETLEAWTNYWLAPSKLGEKHIKPIVSVIISRARLASPKTRSAFIRRCESFANGFNESYDLIKESHPGQALSIAKHAFYKERPIEEAKRLMSNYDALVEIHSEGVHKKKQRTGARAKAIKSFTSPIDEKERAAREQMVRIKELLAPFSEDSIECRLTFKGEYYVRYKDDWLYIDGNNGRKPYTACSVAFSAQLERLSAKQESLSNLIWLLQEKIKAAQAMPS